MLTPEKDAIRINRLINDPSIQPWVCGPMTGVLDATPLIINTDNYFFTAEHGGCSFLKRENGQFELHSYVLPEGRGRWAKHNFEKARDWMFNNTDCVELSQWYH